MIPLSEGLRPRNRGTKLINSQRELTYTEPRIPSKGKGKIRSI